MKRYIFLTSVLALAACGGGSGGGGTSTANDIMASGLVSPSSATSNHVLTDMTSAIVVANDGSSSAVRSSSVTLKGKTYNIYDLSDVKFYIAENPEMGNFKFKVNRDHKITQITETLGDVSATVDRIGDTQRFNGPMFEYVSNTNDGAVTHRIVDDGTISMDYLENIAATGTGGHWNRVDEILDINTEGTGLTFSDFGKFNPVYRSKHKNLNEDMLAQIRAAEGYITEYLNDENNTDTDDLIDWLTTNEYNLLLPGDGHSYKTVAEREDEFENSKDYQLFAGGYAIQHGQLVDTLTPTDGMHFTGKAIGRVYSSIQSDGVDRAALLDQYEIPYYTEDGEQNRTYHIGTTVYAPGDDVPPEVVAAAVHINKAGHDMANAYAIDNATLEINGDTATLSMPFAAQGFYDVTATKVGNADATFEFANKSDDLPTYLAKDATVDTTETSDRFGYYGIDTPSEAAGTVRYYNEKVLDGTVDEPNAWREWEFQGAYGMTKDN